jgi:hypothetical protein
MMTDQTTIDAVAERIGRLVRPEDRRLGMAVIVKGAALEVVDIIKRRYVEQACAGAAVVDRLPAPSTACDSYPDCAPCTGDQACEDPAIPIACAGFPELAGDVARRLLAGETLSGALVCDGCEASPCPHDERGRVGDGEWFCTSQTESTIRVPPPFAAAYADVTIVTEDGQRRVHEWVLASAPCGGCDGTGRVGVRSDFTVAEDGKCDLCNGTGARVDVKAIADRYQPDRPWRDEDTAREARFRVRVG